MKTENTVWCKCIWPLEDESYSICMNCGNQLRKYKKVDEAIYNDIAEQIFDESNKIQEKAKQTNNRMNKNRVIYAIYAQSGFYKSWKFVQVPENVFYPYVEITDALMTFCKEWPGFTELIKMEKTDVKTY